MPDRLAVFTVVLLMFCVVIALSVGVVTMITTYPSAAFAVVKWLLVVGLVIGSCYRAFKTYQ